MSDVLPEVLLEVCVDGPEGLLAAVRGGAGRVELCAALAIGGLTPAPGLMALAAEQPIPVWPLLRVHPGPFRYTPADVRALKADMDTVAGFGLAGVVIGANEASGQLDRAVLAELADHARARGLGLTLHRAFDLAAAQDPEGAVDLAVELGFDRILTSGAARTAEAGLAVLERIVAHAGTRIAILPGSGISRANVDVILDRLGVREVHSSCSGPDLTGTEGERALGFLAEAPRRTDEVTVRALVAHLAARRRAHA
ncbi:copper homeostasis protein CutC [Microvirga tunisiensis]|uniref:PF03932 family protein CutC n=1 Tax=Pannonibacter tanglangensis TaxID=2750084 RepID=A0ABW9ZLU6_9HYPH|nr:copper homeostasis protein CutC [Pannonibacter sp. XCT-34]